MNSTDTCPICDGAGVVTGPEGKKTCACRRNAVAALQRAELLRQSNLTAAQRLWTFANFVSGPGTDHLEAMTRSFAGAPEGWLLLHGPSGQAKSYLSVAVVNECLDREEPAAFWPVVNLLRHFRKSFGGGELDFDTEYERIRDMPILVLDDLATEHATSWAVSELYGLINDRYNAASPTIFTLNDFAWPRLDPRIAARLNDDMLCTRVAVGGKRG